MNQGLRKIDTARVNYEPHLHYLNRFNYAKQFFYCEGAGKPQLKKMTEGPFIYSGITGKISLEGYFLL